MSLRFDSVKKILWSHFVRNVLIIASGTAGAQAITMAFTPVLTRLYSPEAFGVLGTFMAVLGILTPVSALAYPIALVLPEDPVDAQKLARLSLGSSLIFAMLVGGGLFLFQGTITSSLNLHSVSEVFWLIPVAMIFMALYQVLYYWIIRTRQFKVLAFGSVIHSFSLNFAKAGVGFLNPAGLVLVYFGAFGYALHAFILWLRLRQRNAITLSFSKFDFNVRDVAIKYIDFPKFRMPQMLINALSNNMPTVLISFYFGAKDVGLFVLAWTVMSAPAVLIGQSVGSVFYSKVVERLNAGAGAYDVLLKSFVILMLVSVGPYFLIFMFGSYLFELVFGSNWADAGVLASYLSLAIFLGIIHRPCEAYLQASGSNKFYMWYELAFLVVVASILCLSFVLSSDIKFVVISFVLSKASYYLGLIAYSLILSRRNLLNG